LTITNTTNYLLLVVTEQQFFLQPRVKWRKPFFWLKWMNQVDCQVI